MAMDTRKVLKPFYDYELSLIIKGKQYINYTEGVKIVSSLTTGFQIFQIRINMDPFDLSKEDPMRGEKIKLQIINKGEGGTLQKKWDFDLQCIRVDSVFPTTKIRIVDGHEKVRSPVVIVAICEKPLKAMTTIINKIYVNQTPKQIIEDVVSQSGASLQMDSDSVNNGNIKQCLIPPTTVYKTIRLIDDNYGIFDGSSNLGFCQYDNKLYIQNITAKIKKNQTFTIYQMASDADNTEIVKKSIESEAVFYTYGNVIPNYSGVTKALAMAPVNYYIVHPFDDLYDKIKKDVTSLYSSHGLISKNSSYKDYKYDKRERYIHRHSGFEHDETFMNARIGRKLAGIASILVPIEKSMHIMNLLKVGECVKFVHATDMFKELSGKYVLKSSDLTIEKVKNLSRGSNEWVGTCKLTLMRSNQYD